MRITTDMIDPELRGAATTGRFMLQPWPWYFRMISRAAGKAAKGDIDGLDCSEVQIPRADGSTIRTRIYKPRNAAGPLPALLYLHGGGYFMGAPEMFHPIIAQYIAARPCVVIAPEYRKSIDAPYPAALDDCYDTLLWIKTNAATLGVRDDQLFVGGHSAGGGLTAAVSLRARDRRDVNIAYQMPIYPMIDDRMTGESARGNNAPYWNTKLNALGWSFYLDGLKDIPPEAAPARASDYSGLPPTMTFVGDLDPLRDETIAYVENLKRAGVPVEFAVFERAYHGFDSVAADAAVSKSANAFVRDSFANAVDTRFAPQA